jgi:hypothetical protein
MNCRVSLESVANTIFIAAHLECIEAASDVPARKVYQTRQDPQIRLEGFPLAHFLQALDEDLGSRFPEADDTGVWS